jgi:hypothetical protein
VLEQMLLRDLSDRLAGMGKDIWDYGLPPLEETGNDVIIF